MFRPSFAHLCPKAPTYEHVMDGVHVPADNPNPVVLLLKFCGKGSTYWNATAKWKRIADEKQATKRAADKFAEVGIEGWRNVEHDGKSLAYSPEHGIALFDALIAADREDKLDMALGAALMKDNFTEPVGEAGELGKK